MYVPVRSAAPSTCPGDRPARAPVYPAPQPPALPGLAAVLQAGRGPLAPGVGFEAALQGRAAPFKLAQAGALPPGRALVPRRPCPSSPLWGPPRSQEELRKTGLLCGAAVCSPVSAPDKWRLRGPGSRRSRLFHAGQACGAGFRGSALGSCCGHGSPLSSLEPLPRPSGRSEPASPGGGGRGAPAAPPPALVLLSRAAWHLWARLQQQDLPGHIPVSDTAGPAAQGRPALPQALWF